MRNGFSLAGFIYGPFWLMAQRLWLMGALFLAGDLTLLILGSMGKIHPTAAFFLLLVGRFLIGLEGSAWRQRRLARRGYVLQDVVGAYSDAEAFVRALDRAPRAGAPAGFEPAGVALAERTLP